jgi:hypothetical protein
MSVYELPGIPVLSDLITQMLEQVVYGWYPVYDEAIVFATGTYNHTLVAGDTTTIDIHDIIYVNGTASGTEYTFTEATDYEVLDTTGDAKLDTFHWISGGTLPDDETTFYVSYRYQVDPSGLTDITVGSVLRTTMESVGIQIYRAFLKAQEVGRDSYIDTAVGTQLGLLGRLVGVTRNPATRTTGYVTLRRDSTNTSSTVDIPVGTRLATVGTSTVSTVYFQTTKTARIRSGETEAVTYTSETDSDYLQPWIAVEALTLGVDGNVTSGSIIRNTTAPSSVTYVNNLSSYDVSGEQYNGDGTSQVFGLAHPPATVSSFGVKYIQYRHGFISQPSAASQIKFTLNVGGTDYDNATGELLTVKIYGLDHLSAAANETWTLDDVNTTRTTTKSFSVIYYVTFTNNVGGGGIGEGIGSLSTITIQNSGATETYLSAQAAGEQVDSGYLDMIADADYIWFYMWEDNSWKLKTIGTTGSGTNHFHYVDEDTGSFKAGIIYWNDGLGGGSTWTSSIPYYSNFAAGPNADGKNVKIEYYPIEGETGTGEASEIPTGITAFTVVQEYKYGWLNQPGSAIELSISCTNGLGSDKSWDGTAIVHGTTTSGGSLDEEALVFDSGVPDYEHTTTKEFSRIDYVTFSNANNPSEGFGEGSASTTYVRIGTTTKGFDIMDESTCGTRVDGGYLSLIGVDSDNTLKVYVYNSGWTLHTQSAADYTYTDEGSTAGVVNLSATWDWSTPPYVNSHSAGVFGDGRNIMIEYVPINTEYSVSGSQLFLEGAPTNGSLLTLSYTWTNSYIDGSNTEIDSAYRRRISTAIAASAKSTLDAIEAAVLEIDNIEGVVVDDYSTDPTIDIGEVHVFAWTSTGLLDGGTRSLVADVVNENRAAGVKPVVHSPTPIYIAIQATVKVPTTVSRTLSAIKADLDNAVIEYVSGLGINRAMYKSELIDAMEAISEVRYVDVSTIEVWGYDSDTATTVTQEAPYTTTPYWYFDEGVTQDWSNNGNIIYIDSGYVFRPDTNNDGGSGNEAIDITVEYE